MNVPLPQRPQIRSRGIETTLRSPENQVNNEIDGSNDKQRDKGRNHARERRRALLGRVGAIVELFDPTDKSTHVGGVEAVATDYVKFGVVVGAFVRIPLSDEIFDY